MSDSTSIRQEALLKIASNGKVPYEKVTESAVSKFGINTFNDDVMRERLPKDTYKKLRDTIRKGEKLDMSIANTVAHAMKEWAMDKGVSHYTHWFQPQTGLTAEKHDSFLEFDNDHPIERFRGNQLVQSEPDASSFPSGGARTTFEARGYAAWDPSSPAFIVDGPKGGILCIPSVFISYNGEALDKKTPLLRSMDSMSTSALKVLKLFNSPASRVTTTIGTEQEYFLIDKNFFYLRPDLQITGRTLLGAPPPKGQDLDDHYFGSIKERVLAFMQDAEAELYKLSIPAKTRHNEVAPHQFEIAPIYSEANVGADRNQIIMEVLKKFANRHGLALLLHEKPFAGVNGSGKHNNWSMEDSEGNNLLDPGDTPEENLQFLIFLVSILRAVHTHGDLLRMSIASAGNDHRLGANEAPPAILSVFLGERLTTILDDIKAGKTTKPATDFIIDLGISKLPAIFKDNTDRNRTSPFAFTGSKFEFRAVGSSASVSFANAILSGAVADSIDVIMSDIEKTMTGGTAKNEAILKVLQKYIIETEPIRFEGNNYSEEWAKEAEKRGLPNIKRTGYALDALVTPKNKEMLIRQGILSESEINGRYMTKLEQYITTLEIEIETLMDLVNTRVIPAAVSYQNELVAAISGLKMLGAIISEDTLAAEVEILNEVSSNLMKLKKLSAALHEKITEGLKIEDEPQKAKFFADNIVDLIQAVRAPADKLEKTIPDSLWPLPKYQEMLFIM